MTRQNAGRDLNAAAAAALLAFGGMKALAATDSADDTAPFDSLTWPIDSHAIGAASATRGAIATTIAINTAILMSAPVMSERIIRRDADAARSSHPSCRASATVASKTCA